MGKKLLLVGGGGHCKSVLDSLLKLNAFIDIGIIDLKENLKKKVLGFSVIGCDDDLPQLFTNGFKYAFVTAGSVGNPRLRIRLFYKLTKVGFKIPNIVDPSAVLSCHVKMEEGIFIGKNVVINAGCTIHKGSIINTGAIIEHDCCIGEFVHVAPSAVLGGEVQVGENTHIGANCVIKQKLKIGSNSIIGMGSVVLEGIGEGLIAYGNPCRVTNKRNGGGEGFLTTVHNNKSKIIHYKLPFVYKGVVVV